MDEQTRPPAGGTPAARYPDRARAERHAHTEPHIYFIDADMTVHLSASARLERAGFPVQTFASADGFLEIASTLQHGCIISDLRMPEPGGLGLPAELRRRGLNFPVILAAADSDVAMAMKAIHAGAIDFMEKPFTDDAFDSSIGRALAALAQSRRRGDNQRIASERVASLTHRECDVLQGLIAGKSNRHIAGDLAISVRTVEFYRGRTMRKMRAGGLSELIQLALAAGVAPASDMRRPIPR